MVEAHLVAPSLVQLVVQTGRIVEAARHEPYSAEPGDQIARNGTLRRGGRVFGQLIGEDRGTMLRLACYEDDALAGRLAAGELDDPAGYRMRRATGRDAAVTELRRKSKIIDTARLDRREFGFVIAHTITIALAEPVGPDERLEVLTPFAEAPIAVDRTSPAIRVNHLGFEPGDPFGAGYLSYWAGAGKPFDLAMGDRFELVDDVTGGVVFEGVIELETAKDAPPALGGADVYRLDFSSFDEPGVYRICAAGVCSEPFAVRDGVWLDGFRLAMRGFMSQRSGIELGPPWSDWQRPRSLHPDDGMVAQRSLASLADTSMGLNLLNQNSFKALVEGATDEEVPGAWGGWHDAGDWDRRAQHLEIAGRLLLLLEMRPDLAQVELAIPERGGAVPDLLDEALWCIDLFARLQNPEGGVPGGIESAGHPRFGESSWTETQPRFVYAPDPWASWAFAAASARAARLLRDLAAERAGERADDLSERALRAMAWAEAAGREWMGRHHQLRHTRNLAALELYRLTGERHWHELFAYTSSYGERQHLDWKERQLEAGFVYAALTDGADPDIAAHARANIVERANYLLGAPAGGFGQIVDPHRPYGYSYTSTVAADAYDVLIFAHALTGERSLLEAIIGETQFGLGANPDGMAYITGLGSRSPPAPLVVDMLALADRTPPPGITIFGHFDATRRGHGLLETAGAVMWPRYPAEWPVHEMYVGFPSLVPVSEYSIRATIGPTAFVMGYLAGRPGAAHEQRP